MLELFEVDNEHAIDLNTLHETVESLPHVLDGLGLLILESQIGRDLVTCEPCYDFLVSGWVVLEIHLLHASLVREGPTEQVEQVSHFHLSRQFNQSLSNFLTSIANSEAN